MAKIGDLFKKVETNYESSDSFRSLFNLSLLLLLSVFTLFVVVQPAVSSLSEKASRVAGVRNVEENLLARSNRIQEASNKINELSKSDTQTVRDAIPTSPDVLNYIESLENLATAHNVSLKVVSSKNSPLTSAVSNYKELEAVEINAFATGNFSNLKRFISSISDNNRISKLTKLRLSNTASEQTLNADLGLDIYYIK